MIHMYRRFRRRFRQVTDATLTYCPGCQVPPTHFVGQVLAAWHPRCWREWQQGSWSPTDE
jgi:hypothetical protein